MNGPRIVRIEPGEQLLIGDRVAIRLRSDWVRGVTLEVAADAEIAVERWNPTMLARAMARRQRK